MLFRVHLIHQVANVRLVIRRLKLFQEECFLKNQIKILNSHKFSQTDVNQGLKSFFDENYSFTILSLTKGEVHLMLLIAAFLTHQ